MPLIGHGEDIPLFKRELFVGGGFILSLSLEKKVLIYSFYFCYGICLLTYCVVLFVCLIVGLLLSQAFRLSNQIDHLYKAYFKVMDIDHSMIGARKVIY